MHNKLMQFAAMESVADRLKKARIDAGFNSVAAASKALGVPYPTYAGHENGARGITPDMLAKYATRYKVSVDWLIGGKASKFNENLDTSLISGMPVLGTARAGAFLDITMIDAKPNGAQTIAVASDLRFAHAKQYALLIDGESMNRQFDNGSYVTCAEWADTGLELQPGMCLHVERYQAGLTEVTVKVFRIIDGVPWLCPDSDKPKFEPLPVEGDDGTDIVIKGLVIGTYRQINYKGLGA